MPDSFRILRESFTRESLEDARGRVIRVRNCIVSPDLMRLLERDLAVAPPGDEQANTYREALDRGQIVEFFGGPPGLNVVRWEFERWQRPAILRMDDLGVPLPNMQRLRGPRAPEPEAVVEDVDFSL